MSDTELVPCMAIHARVLLTVFLMNLYRMERQHIKRRQSTKEKRLQQKTDISSQQRYLQLKNLRNIGQKENSSTTEKDIKSERPVTKNVKGKLVKLQLNLKTIRQLYVALKEM